MEASRTTQEDDLEAGDDLEVGDDQVTAEVECRDPDLNDKIYIMI